MKIYQAIVYGNIVGGCAEDNWDVTVYVGTELDKAVSDIVEYQKNIKDQFEIDGSQIDVWENGTKITTLKGDGEEET